MDWGECILKQQSLTLLGLRKVCSCIMGSQVHERVGCPTHPLGPTSHRGGGHPPGGGGGGACLAWDIYIYTHNSPTRLACGVLTAKKGYRLENVERAVPPSPRDRFPRRSWYQDLGNKILVPRSWYQDPGTKILVPRSWYQDPVTKILVPRSWY